MIPGPTPSGYAWRANPIQRARQAQESAAFAPKPRQPFSRPIAELKKATGAPLKTATIFEFPEAAAVVHDEAAPPLADHWFVSKNGRTMSDAAIRLLRLRGWLEICTNDRKFESEAYITECRLREQAAYIIGYGA
jgi:hypothetical protein